MRPKTVDREDVMSRARQMRAQLMAEIERAKVELWETTMEGGCLAHVLKDLGKRSVGDVGEGEPVPDETGV